MSKSINSSQWVAPDFNDLSLEIRSTSYNPTATNSDSSKSSCFSSNFLNLKNSSKTQNRKNQFVPFVTKHQPRSRDDLAVHKRKIDEVEVWLKNVALDNSSLCKFLLLTGPCGSGKTATLKVLAETLGMQIIEWTNGQSLQTFRSGDAGGSGYSGSGSTVEVNVGVQSQDFSDFLLRAEKCSSLAYANSCLQENSGCRLILVEEIPNVFVKDPKSFWNILRFTGRKMRLPLVFVCTDSHSRQEHQDFFSYKRLFPQNFLDELHFTVINFNPVAHTALVKVLKNIVENETNSHHTSAYNKRRKVAGKKSDGDLIDRLASSCNGDVRSAVNSLQFLLVNSPTGAPPSGEDLFERDTSMVLFRALGKFLYSKRQPYSGEHHLADIAYCNAQNIIPRSGQLNFDPEAIVDQSCCEPDSFALFLHENYVNLADDIDTCVEISRVTSYADFLTKDWSLKQISNRYSVSLIGRAVAFYMDDESRKEKGRSFAKMVKPQFFNATKTIRNHNELLIENFQVSEIRLGSALRLDIAPYLCKLGNKVRLKSPDQWRIVEDIGRFPIKQHGQFVKSFQPKRRFDTIDDHDLSLDFEEINEDEKNSKLSSTQTESVPDFVADVCIEEYDDS